MKKFSRKEFLLALFGDYFERQNGFVMVKATKHLDRRVSTRYFPNVEILAKEQYTPDQDVYFGVCPRETMKPERTHIRFMTALWAGLDLGPEGYSGKDVFFTGPASAAKAVRSFPLAPSVVIESGWGMHLYWLLGDLVEIVDKDHVERLLRKISSYFQCGNHVGIDAMLRLPGTFNCKMIGKSVPCDVKYMNTDFTYTLEDFERLTLGSEVAVKARAETREAEATRSQEIVPEAPSRSAGSAAEHPQVTEDLSEYLFSEPDDKIPSDIEPLFYEPARKHRDNENPLLSDAVVESVADRIVDRVVDNLSRRLIGEIADEIVEKLTKRLTSG
ncbi:MAG: hypothetical protein RDU20_01120 [Desulfomonilaceae bacterium]|nr:hypothetical protein [Desulfomonilaceae bacterium]